MNAAPPPAAAARPFAAADWFWAAALAVATMALYAQVRSFGYVQLDDQFYVANNPYVARGLTWAGVRWAATARVVENWHPLTLWGEMAVSSAFGFDPGPFHLANAVLHGANVGLLFAALRWATGRRWPAVAAAALWGWHPLRVESVAWVAELKDVLCGTMWLGCAVAYVGYARRGRRPGWYAAVVAMAALAMLAKPMAVTLPFALLLLDYWPLGDGLPGSPPGRWWAARVWEKLPIVALAAVTATVAARSQGSLPVPLRIPFTVRLQNAAVAVPAYLRDVAVPGRLGLV